MSVNLAEKICRGKIGYFEKSGRKLTLKSLAEKLTAFTNLAKLGIEKKIGRKIKPTVSAD